MSLSHSFSVDFAELYGVECAILINHFQFWIRQNKKANKNFHDGKTWMYQTQKEICSIYPYWSEKSVQRNIQKLLNLGIIVKSNYNDTAYDRTCWYAFQDEEKFNITRNRVMDSTKSSIPFDDIESPIPDTNTDTKQQAKVVVGKDNRFPLQNEKQITKDDLYHYSLKSRKDWKPEEIESAWLAYSGAKAPISDPHAYIDGVIKNKRILADAKQKKDNTCQKKYHQKNLDSTRKMETTSKEKLEPTKIPPSVQDTPGPLLDFLKSPSYNKKR